MIQNFTPEERELLRDSIENKIKAGEMRLRMKQIANGTLSDDTPGMAEIRARVIKEKRVLEKLEEE